MKIVDVYAQYGEVMLGQLEQLINRSKLLQKNLALHKGDEPTTFETVLLSTVGESVAEFEMVYDILQDYYRQSKDIVAEKFANATNSYFRFDDAGEIREVSEEEAAHYGMLSQDQEEQYENYGY